MGDPALKTIEQIQENAIAPVSALRRWLVGAGAVAIGLVGCNQPIELRAQEQRPFTPSRHLAQRSTNADVDALVKLGPRVAGTPVMEQASGYLVEEFRKAGYVATIQPFTYTKYVDQGSTLTVSGATLKGQALRGASSGTQTGRLIAVPGVGRAQDFATVTVKGAIAVVLRGEIPFTEKVQNAADAGAIGVVIVNNQAGNVAGVLTRESTIPVLALSQEQGKALLERSPQPTTATLTVNAGRRTITGRNVVAHLAGVTQPKVLLGGHYDSVAGSPGANDNASGTAVVLAIARDLARTTAARQTWFVAFDGEEDGLHGSRAFVQSASPAFLKGLKGMLNFDMVGVNDQLRANGSAELTQLVRLADSNTTTSGNAGGSSDHASFAAAGVPVLFFHRGLEPNYHSPNDKTIRPNLLDETTQTALEVVKQLAIAP